MTPDELAVLPDDADSRGPSGFGPQRPVPGARNYWRSYEHMIGQLRALQDRVAGTAPPAEVVDYVAHTLAGLAARVESFGVDERRQVFGHLGAMPGRGQTMAPVFVPDGGDVRSVTGRVTFGRFYLGGNGAVHGGAIPLLFDEVLGRLANTGDRAMSRTAYLHVDYRSIAPIGTELAVHAWFEREEGRKRVLRATLKDGDVLCAEAEGLFVALLPGQP